MCLLLQAKVVAYLAVTLAAPLLLRPHPKEVVYLVVVPVDPLHHPQLAVVYLVAALVNSPRHHHHTRCSLRLYDLHPTILYLNHCLVRWSRIIDHRTLA
jgi:hypothetical protein